MEVEVTFADSSTGNCVLDGFGCSFVIIRIFEVIILLKSLVRLAIFSFLVLLVPAPFVNLRVWKTSDPCNSLVSLFAPGWIFDVFLHHELSGLWTLSIPPSLLASWHHALRMHELRRVREAHAVRHLVGERWEGLAVWTIDSSHLERSLLSTHELWLVHSTLSLHLRSILLSWSSQVWDLRCGCLVWRRHLSISDSSSLHILIVLELTILSFQLRLWFLMRNLSGERSDHLWCWINFFHVIRSFAIIGSDLFLNFVFNSCNIVLFGGWSIVNSTWFLDNILFWLFDFESFKFLLGFERLTGISIFVLSLSSHSFHVAISRFCHFILAHFLVIDEHTWVVRWDTN